jgi:glycosyltransferase involved in cell wall biosynthesis
MGAARDHALGGSQSLQIPPVPADGAIGLSVIMPAFNEELRIGTSIDVVCDYLKRAGRTWELIIVDDGSSDLTAAVATAMVQKEPRARLIRTPHNRGKGHALRTGVMASRGEDVLISDADLSTPIHEIERLLAARNGAVAAIGSRSCSAWIEIRQGRLREVLGRLGNRIIRILAVPGVGDTQCGFKLFRGPAARALFGMAKINGWATDVEILHLCTRFGWPVTEVPVHWAHATGSKLRPSAYVHVLAEIAHLRIAHRQAQAPALEATAQRLA